MTSRQRFALRRNCGRRWVPERSRCERSESCRPALRVFNEAFFVEDLDDLFEDVSLGATRQDAGEGGMEVVVRLALAVYGCDHVGRHSREVGRYACTAAQAGKLYA